MSRSARELRLQARDALVRGRVASVVRAHDWPLLERIAEMAARDAPVELAASDPAEFATLRAAITRYHLAGWSDMTPARVRGAAAFYRDRVAAKEQA